MQHTFKVHSKAMYVCHDVPFLPYLLAIDSIPAPVCFRSSLNSSSKCCLNIKVKQD